MIVSRMHGLALDVQGGNRNPGAQVVPWNRTGSDGQLWYDDHSTGTIRSKLNGFCLDIEGMIRQSRSLYGFCLNDKDFSGKRFIHWNRPSNSPPAVYVLCSEYFTFLRVYYCLFI